VAGWELGNWWIDISPDGKKVVFEDMDGGGGQGVRNLETGETLAIEEGGLWTEWGRFSPDGRQVAFSACCEEGYSLRIGPADRAESRVLLNKVQGAETDNPDFLFLTPWDWSPDGQKILVSLRYEVAGDDGRPPARQSIMAEVSVADGSYQPLGERPGRSPRYFQSRGTQTIPGRTRMNDPKYSPDGRFLAFNVPQDGTRISDLFTLRLEDEVETDLGEEGGLIGWRSDGGGVFYSRDENTVWFLPVRDGARAGEPRLIHPGLAERPLWVEDDRIFYIVTAERPGLHTMELDLASGRVLSSPTPVREDDNEGAWSPDGRYLAYDFREETTGRGGVAVRSVSGNNRREFLGPEDGNKIQWIRWMPDSKALLVNIRIYGDASEPSDPTPIWHLMRVDLDTGEWTDLSRVRLPLGVLADNGSTLYTRTRTGIAAFELGKFGGGDGRGAAEGEACPPEQEAWELGDCRTVFAYRPETEGCLSRAQYLALSPDQGEILATNEACAFRIPVEGGTPEIVYQGAGITGSPEWTPDGEHILFTSTSKTDESIGDLRILPASGGTVRTLFSFPNLSEIQIHPDGRRVLFSGGEHIEELWVLENLPRSGSY
jgi:Tol biopolymer transport system component